MNTYYTVQSKYTSSIINGIATHEMGHALGLDHSNSTSSVMFPYTFYSDGSLARTTTSPGSDDKAALASLYGHLAIAPQSDVSANPDVKSDNIVMLHPSWAVGYKDIQSLAKDADMIIEGTIEHSKLKKNAPDDFLSYKTEHTIQITDVLKGDRSFKHSSMSFNQLGGIDSYASVTYDTGTLLHKGDHVILFLRKDDNGEYSLINENDSIFFAGDLTKKEYKYLKNNEKFTKDQIQAKIK
ncbi:matrixin family metalloprotease [Anoxybacteroides tepidamans]|uniref:matrixin family metalloprotease n=1 Tax=Anoxybacteroides tepidamans TaxID=265948 RepID=UPI000480FE82|nr:matrixin family metalloprotease [Anoxybacillus tepidamans]